MGTAVHMSTSRWLSAFPSSRRASPDKAFQELLNLSYWQNERASGFELEPLPALKVDGVPIVHHPSYSAPRLPQGHRFPMQIFQTIHDSLTRDGVVKADQVRAQNRSQLRYSQ
jgi:hypothetical protein